LSWQFQKEIVAHFLATRRRTAQVPVSPSLAGECALRQMKTVTCSQGVDDQGAYFFSLATAAVI
jgi:hypothetical protein